MSKTESTIRFYTDRERDVYQNISGMNESYPFWGMGIFIFDGGFKPI